jgi:hypothetical protein
MNLADLDRKPVTWRYDRWDTDVVFRPISAAMLAKFAGLNGEDVDTPAALRFYAELLAVSLESHKFTAEEWMDASGKTLQMLGMQALRINGLLAEEAKKN